MSLALAGASASTRVPLSRAASSSARIPSSGLLLLYLQASSLFAPATASRHSGTMVSASTCPVVPNTCAPHSTFPSTRRAFHSSPKSWRAANSGPGPRFSYRVAASYSAKGDRFAPARNTYTAEPFDPSPPPKVDIQTCKAALDKRLRPRSGQDAFFYAQIGNSSLTTFGVADGVGGWIDSGIDPADFSHGLCEYMACAARIGGVVSAPENESPSASDSDSSARAPAALHPKDLLQIGYDAVIGDNSIVGGGSTACLAVANPSGAVEVANLGDSGFMHLGLNAVRHFTHPQTHAFNTPFQLSKTPQKMLVQMAVFGGSSALSDLPKESNVTHHSVRHGEVLVFATDGVWDNLSTQDVLAVVSRTMEEQGAWVEKDGAIEVGEKLAHLTQAGSKERADLSSLQAIVATAIAKEAKETSHNSRRDGPFAKEVQRWYPGENWHGGKPDDIAVVVAVVVEESGPKAKL